MMESLKKLKEREHKKKRMGLKSDRRKPNKNKIWKKKLSLRKKMQLKELGPNLKD
jgi:hypothetical protein